MNAMMHQWCHPADFDGWADSGAAGWSWNDVAPVFRAQERWLGGDGDSDRGRSGPMRIVPNRNVRSLTHGFVEAARRAGLGNDHRYNGCAYQGAWIAELAQRSGRRFTTYEAYLKPAMRRANLRVLTHSQAVRIVVDAGRATGVVIHGDGGERTFSAPRRGACGRGVRLASAPHTVRSLAPWPRRRPTSRL